MRVAFDIGGTFTDVIVLGDDGQLTTAKVLSLLGRVGEDIVACVRQASTTPRVENFVHGTTIAANAVIENKIAVTGLLTTQGFRDELEMRAVMSLARLWQQQGKHHAARNTLAEVYNWFTEGFDTKDLQEAKELLAERAEG